MYHWQLDGKGCALAQLAIHLDFAVVQVYHLLHIRQAQSESLHIMHIACMNSIELVEDLLQALLLHAQARIRDGEIEMLLIVPSLHRDVEWLIWLAILHGVVHQIEDDILEMNLVYIQA